MNLEDCHNKKGNQMAGVALRLESCSHYNALLQFWLEETLSVTVWQCDSVTPPPAAGVPPSPPPPPDICSSYLTVTIALVLLVWAPGDSFVFLLNFPDIYWQSSVFMSKIDKCYSQHINCSFAYLELIFRMFKLPIAWYLVFIGMYQVPCRNIGVWDEHNTITFIMAFSCWCCS